MYITQQFSPDGLRPFSEFHATCTAYNLSPPLSASTISKIICTLSPARHSFRPLPVVSFSSSSSCIYFTSSAFFANVKSSRAMTLLVRPRFQRHLTATSPGHFETKVRAQPNPSSLLALARSASVLLKRDFRSSSQIPRVRARRGDREQLFFVVKDSGDN